MRVEGLPRNSKKKLNRDLPEMAQLEEVLAFD